MVIGIEERSLRKRRHFFGHADESAFFVYNVGVIIHRVPYGPNEIMCSKVFLKLKKHYKKLRYDLLAVDFH